MNTKLFWLPITRIRRAALSLFYLAIVGFGLAQPALSQAADTGADAVTTKLFLPTVAKPFRCSQRNPSPIFGVQMYTATGPKSKFHSSLLSSGANRVRVPISWYTVDPDNRAPSQYKWTRADAVMRAATSTCVNVIATHLDAPSWAASHLNGAINRASEADFVEYITALVERYDGDGITDAPGNPVVNHWEFYNEPDAAPLPGMADVESWSRNGALYVHWLRLFFTAAKNANPNARILLGGIAHDWFEDEGGAFVPEFLDDVLEADGGNYFDVMNFHTYPAFRREWTEGLERGPGLIQKTEYMRAKLQEYGITNKPIMITESGWHSNDDGGEHPSSPEDHSRYVVELLVQGLVADVRSIIYWLLGDLEDFYPFESGLVTNDTPPQVKPAMTAYQNVIKLLKTAQYERTLSENEREVDTMEAYQFADPVNNTTIYVAWMDPVNTTETHPLRVHGETASVIDIYGASTTVQNKDDGVDDTKVKVTITGQPVFIVVAN